MTEYEAMRAKLMPLGVYTLAQGSLVDCELKAYAAGLEPLQEQLREMEREAFIVTAQTYGLSERERFIDREQTDLSVAARRSLLLGSEQALGADATPAGFVRMLSSFGLTSFHITERPAQNELLITIDDVLSDSRKSLISEKIAQAAPAHLVVTVTYGGE